MTYFKLKLMILALKNVTNHPDMHLMSCQRCVLVFTEFLDFLKQIIILIWDFLLLLKLLNPYM